jgi:hypothetical protein
MWARSKSARLSTIFYYFFGSLSFDECFDRCFDECFDRCFDEWSALMNVLIGVWSALMNVQL